MHSRRQWGRCAPQSSHTHIFNTDRNTEKQAHYVHVGGPVARHTGSTGRETDWNWVEIFFFLFCFFVGAVNNATIEDRQRETHIQMLAGCVCLCVYMKSVQWVLCLSAMTALCVYVLSAKRSTPCICVHASHTTVFVTLDGRARAKPNNHTHACVFWVRYSTWLRRMCVVCVWYGALGKSKLIGSAEARACVSCWSRLHSSAHSRNITTNHDECYSQLSLLHSQHFGLCNAMFGGRIVLLLGCVWPRRRRPNSKRTLIYSTQRQQQQRSLTIWRIGVERLAYRDSQRTTASTHVC